MLNWFLMSHRLGLLKTANSLVALKSTSKSTLKLVTVVILSEVFVGLRIHAGELFEVGWLFERFDEITWLTLQSLKRSETAPCNMQSIKQSKQLVGVDLFNKVPVTDLQLVTRLTINFTKRCNGSGALVFPFLMVAGVRYQSKLSFITIVPCCWSINHCRIR